MTQADPVPLWEPSADRKAQANLTRFIQEVNGRWKADCSDHASLFAWSIREPENFWQSVWSFAGVVGDMGAGPYLVDADKMPGARWFPNARLNFAQNLLRRRDHATALVFWGENKVRRKLSFAQLNDQVSVTAQALRAMGVQAGDRVAAVMPNMPETVIALLATTSIGAIWSSCSPDFGVQGVLDRFGQIEPKVLFCVDGYYYSGKIHDTLPRMAEIVRRLPTLKQVVVVPYLIAKPLIGDIPKAVHLSAFIGALQPAEIAFEQVPFNHPLYILYSSGTTGVPKCIVHGTGGTLLQHVKEHQLHTDLKRGDRLFYFTTCGWMMWNWLVSGLATGATLLMYDGSPFYPNPSVLFDLADTENMSIFGTSAKYIDALAKLGVKARDTHRLDSVKTMTSTGSPLAPESFD
jgi:acetoacetyl-CoA synthetase